MIAPSRRLIASCLLLMAASLLISLLGLAQGPVPLTIDQVFSALFGDAPRNVAMVVNEWRLPRVLMALLIGAALGVSGAIFQSLTRNPLGSPDVMGLNTGAWSGVLVAMVLFGQDLTAIALAAMVGGIVTSLLVWLLAWRNGIDTFRLIIIGIGVRAMKLGERTGLLVGAWGVGDGDEMIVITGRGRVVRLQASEISSLSRTATGYTVVKLDENDVVADVSIVRSGEKPEEE